MENTSCIFRGHPRGGRAGGVACPCGWVTRRGNPQSLDVERTWTAAFSRAFPDEPARRLPSATTAELNNRVLYARAAGGGATDWVKDAGSRLWEHDGRLPPDKSCGRQRGRWTANWDSLARAAPDKIAPTLGWPRATPDRPEEPSEARAGRDKRQDLIQSETLEPCHRGGVRGLYLWR